MGILLFLCTHRLVLFVATSTDAALEVVAREVAGVLREGQTTFKWSIAD